MENRDDSIIAEKGQGWHHYWERAERNSKVLRSCQVFLGYLSAVIKDGKVALLKGWLILH